MLQFIAAYVLVTMVPGPVSFATGGFAVLHGFSKTLPLLAGIGVGRAVLTALMAFGAVHLAAILSLPAARTCGAAVLCAMAWRMVRAAPPATSNSSGRFRGDLFLEGVLVGFLSPQTAALYAVALVALMLDAPALGNSLSIVVIVTVITVGWHAVVAALFSHTTIRAAALRHHRAICRTAATTLCSMALYSALPTVGA
jgi:threonine/homoserine/homoserine lactone efflux protein